MPSLRKAAAAGPLRLRDPLSGWRPARLVLVLGVLVAFVVLALAALSLWRLHAVELAIGHRHLTNLSRALAEHASRTLETIDLTLGAGINLLEETGPDPRHQDQVERLLRTQAQALPYVTSLAIYDVRGEARFSSPVPRGALPASIADSPLLALHRDRTLRGMQMSLVDRAGGVSQAVLVLSRRIEGPGRDLRGVIAAAFDAHYLAGFYQAIELSADASIAVADREGRAVAVHPWNEELIGRPVAAAATAPTSLEDLPQGVVRHSGPDGRGILHTATAAVANYGLSVSVSESERAVLAPWRRQVATIGGSATLIAALSLAIALLLERHLRRREEMLAQLRESEASLTEAHRIAQLGSWSVERNGAVTCSLEASRLFAAPPTALRSLDDIAARIVEEDRADALRALRPLLAGSACDTEFRVRTVTGDERWLSVRAEAAAPASPRARCTVMDVTEQKRADVARQHLAAIVEWTDDAVMSIAPDGRVLSWNAGAARMFGHEARETVGAGIDQVFPEVEARETRRLIELVTDGMSIESYETVRTTKDGRAIDVAVTLSPIRDRAGRVVAASAVARDVTMPRQAQARTQVEHAVMRELAERDDAPRSIAQALRIVCERMGWRTACCWTGAAAAELAVTAAWRAPPGSWGAAAPPVQKVFSAGEPVWIHDLAAAPSDLRTAFGADAGLRSVAIVPLMAGATPLGVAEFRADTPIGPDAAWLQTLGAVGSQIGLFLERRRAEAALRESESRFRSLADLSSDWYWEQDAELRFAAVSAGFAHTGLEAGEFLGRRCWEIDAVVISAGSWAAHRETVAQRTPFHDLELMVTAVAGETRFVSMSGEPVFDAGGEFHGYRGIARDITQRKVAEVRRGMEHAIAYLLAESAPVSTTLPQILETICVAFGWERGLQWSPAGEGNGHLVLDCSWKRGPAPGTGGPLAEPGRTIPAPAGGPAAEAWSSAEPAWVEDIAAEPDYPQRAEAVADGMRSAFLVPVTLGVKVVALLEFLSSRARRHDSELIASARTIGAQVGQYMERRHAEEELRAGKEYIDHVIASAPTLIATVAPDGTTRSVNPAIRDIAIHAPADIEGRNFWKVLNAGDGPDHIDALLEQAAHGRVADHRMGITTRTGERRELSVSIAARHAADGGVVEYVLVGADITDHQLDERRRAAEHAVARALSEATSVDEGLTGALRAVCEILDWECGVFRPVAGGDRLEARSVWSVDSAQVREFVEALRLPREPRPHGIFARTVELRVPVYHARVADSDYRLRDAALAAGMNGLLSVPVEAGERVLGALQFLSHAIRRPTEAFLASMLAIGRQVGQFIEQRRAEQAQQQADERLRGIAANIPGIVFEYRLNPDDTAAFSYVSERAHDMLEETAEALMKDPQLMFNLVERKHRPGLLRSMHVSRHTGALWLYEMPIRTRSGQLRWMRGQSMPKYLEDGSVVWDGVIVDVTAQKQAEQAIQQMNEQLERRVTERTTQLSVANRELESFAYSVSHDLRAPLRSIDGFSRILMEEYGEKLEASAKDYLTRVRAASQRMGELIDDLLSLAQVTRSELKRVRTDLSAMASAIVNDLRTAAPERDVAVSIHPGLTCMADPSLMRIALENLLGNAWKFTCRKQQASIEFGALQQRGKTVYYVRDDGAGFDMAHAGKLFGAFQRLHSPRDFDGTGIGLATVSRIIDRHGGRIWAEAAVGEGATFYFTLTRGRR